MIRPTIASLLPGASAAVTGYYVLTQDDIVEQFLKHSIRNGQGPDNGDVTGTDDDSQTLPQNPAMTVTKIADKDEFTEVGDVISYTVTVTNTGNVTLKNVVVSDSLVSPLPAPSGDNTPCGVI